MRKLAKQMGKLAITGLVVIFLSLVLPGGALAMELGGEIQAIWQGTL